MWYVNWKIKLHTLLNVANTSVILHSALFRRELWSYDDCVTNSNVSHSNIIFSGRCTGHSDCIDPQVCLNIGLDSAECGM